MRHRTSWELHVTVEYPVDEPTDSDDPTYIGFDVGESALITGCALKRDVPTDPMLVNGSRARQLRKEMFTTLRRLQQRDAAEWRIDERFTHYQNALTDIVEQASRRAVEYARQFENPVLVMEDLSYIRERLDYGKFMNRRLHAWAFARLQGRIDDKATEAGIRVEYVNPAYTSQTCHACNRLGRRNQQAAFVCPHDDCHVTTFHADINAVAGFRGIRRAAGTPRVPATAAKVASRANPWGESVPWKPERDDFLEDSKGVFQWSENQRFSSTPRDGSGRDTATGHRESSPRTGQTTLSAYSG